MITATEKARFEAIVTETLERLAAYHGIETPRPTVKWDLRGKSCLGMAIGDHTIRLHAEAAAKLPDYHTTAVHEACHVFVSARKKALGIYSREGRWAPHGAEWKAAMRFVGVRPDRTATVPTGTLTPARTVAKVKVSCACTTYEITPKRAANLSRLSCRLCRKSLVLGELVR